MKNLIPLTIKGPVCLVMLQAMALLIVGGLTLRDPHLYWNPARFQSGDVWLYYKSAFWIRHGVMPYRDFALEYPPLSVVPFLAPLVFVGGQAVTFTTYCWLLLAENVILSALFALLLDSLARSVTPRRGGAVVWCVASVVLLSPFLPWRYDLFPALMTLLALRSVRHRRPVAAGIWLGIGVAAKLYPVVFLPVLFAYHQAQKDTRAGARLLASCFVTVLVSVLPFAPAGAHILSFLQYHQHRGIELESVAAGGLLMTHLLWHAPVMIDTNYGAFHLTSPSTPVLLKIMPWAALLLLGMTTAWAWRRFREEVAGHGHIRFETLVLALTAMLLAFILTNKVFSPQYMVWLLPLFPLLAPRRVPAFGAAVLLTTLIFPFSLGALLAGQPWAVGLLVLRNSIIAGVWLALVALPRRFPVSSPRPALPIIPSRKVLGNRKVLGKPQ